MTAGPVPTDQASTMIRSAAVGGIATSDGLFWVMGRFYVTGEFKKIDQIMTQNDRVGVRGMWDGPEGPGGK